MFDRRRFNQLAATGALSILYRQRASNDVAWLDDVQTPPQGFTDDSGLPSLVVSKDGTPIESIDKWNVRRREIIRQWQQFLGKLPRNPDQPPKTRVLDSFERTIDGKPIVTQRIAYESLPGEATEAYVLFPKGLQGRTPGFVVFHSTVPHCIHQPAGVQGKSEKAFGLELA